MTTLIRRALVQGFYTIAEFHRAAGNLDTARMMARHALDVARLEESHFGEVAEREGDLLALCATHAPFRGVA